MIAGTHERRADTGFTNAQLALYLFLAASAMFYGALYSSFALLRTAAEQWDQGHRHIIGGLGGLALVALVVAALTPRLTARPMRIAAAAQLLAAVVLGGMIPGLLYETAPPAASIYYALAHLFVDCTALHAIGGAAVSAHFAAVDRKEPGSHEARSRARLSAAFAGAVAVFWAVSLGLLLFG